MRLSNVAAADWLEKEVLQDNSIGGLDEIMDSDEADTDGNFMMDSSPPPTPSTGHRPDIATMNLFLNGLTEHSINLAISCFRAGLVSCTVLPSDFDPAHAQRICDRIIRLTAKASMATSIVTEIPKFWVNISGLSGASNLSAIESCITRAFCMQGALRLHHWLLKTVSAAVESKSHGKSWIDKLIWDVKLAIRGKCSVTFESAKYIPKLAFHSAYSYTPNTRCVYSTEAITETVMSTVRQWLQFPSDETSLVQLSLIDIVHSRSPPSILFLDQIWKMYSTPFSTVFNRWKEGRSKTKIEQALKEFCGKYSSHSFTQEGSSEYRKLLALDQLINAWMEKNCVSTTATDTVS